MAKYCTMCFEDKDLSDYHKCEANPDGLQYRCKACCAKANKASRAKRNPEDARRVKQEWYQQNREISIARSRKYRQDHPDWAKAMDAKHNKVKTWRQRNPDKAKANYIRQAYHRRFKKHGLTEASYLELKAKQDSRCAICGVVPDGGYGGLHDGFHIDHDHVTGRVRGLLCKHCNVGIGMLKESETVFQAALEYLRQNR